MQEAETHLMEHEHAIANLEEKKVKLETRRAEFIATSERVREKAVEVCPEDHQSLRLAMCSKISPPVSDFGILYSERTEK